MERATQERLVGATLLIVAGVILIPWLLDGSMTQQGTNEQELVLPGAGDSGNETRRISLEVPRQSAPGAAAGNLPSASSSSAAGSVQEVDARNVRAADEPPAMQLPKPVSTPASTSQAPARFAKPMPKSESPATQPAPVAVVAKIDPPATTTVTETKPEKPAARVVIPVVEERPAPKPEPVAIAPPAPTEGVWAVQVGSFASEDNAERLAARLRDKSYKAFVMRNVLNGRVLYRVRVGPVSERNQAELLATALREDRQPAKVLSHP